MNADFANRFKYEFDAAMRILTRISKQHDKLIKNAIELDTGLESTSGQKVMEAAELTVTQGIAVQDAMQEFKSATSHLHEKWAGLFKLFDDLRYTKFS